MFEKVSLRSALDFAWQVFCDKLLFFVGSIVLAGGLCFSKLTLLDTISQRLFWGASIAGHVLGILVLILLQIALFVLIIKSGLEYYEKGETNLGDLFTDYLPSLDFLLICLSYIGTMVLLGLMLFHGYILLVLPGLYLQVKSLFALYYVVDKEQDPIKALQKSFYATDKKELGLFFTLILFKALYSLLALILFFGLVWESAFFIILGIVSAIVVIPLSLIGLGWIYKENLAKEE